MKRYFPKSNDGKGISALQDKTHRFLRTISFLWGTLLKEKDAQGEIQDYIELTHATPATFRHGLGRTPKGFIVVSSFGTTATSHSVHQVDNVNGDPDDEFIRLYSASSGGLSIVYKIWVY